MHETQAVCIRREKQRNPYSLCYDIQVKKLKVPVNLKEEIHDTF